MSQNWDINASPYENTKSNLIATRSAQNRFGRKFVKYFNRHKEVSNDRARYSIINGVRSLFKSDDYQARIDEIRSLLDDFSHFAVANSGTNASIDDALPHSYIRAVYAHPTLSIVPGADISAMKFVLSSGIDAADNDKRKKAVIIQDGLFFGNNIVLDPLESSEDTFGLSLYDKDGIVYGHGQREIPQESDLETLFVVDGYHDKNVDNAFIFSQTLLEDFDAMRVLFRKYVSEYITMTQAYETGDGELLFSLGQFKDFLESEIAAYQERIDNPQDEERAREDRELLSLLNMQEQMVEKLKGVHRLKNVTIRFQREFTMPESGKWWEAKGLSEVKPMGLMKDIIQAHADVQDSVIVLGGEETPVAPGEKFMIIPKASFLDLPAWQVTLFVYAFLDLDVSVKKKWYQKGIFKVIVAIVTVALIVLTDNPAFIKTLLVASSLGAQFGIIGGKLQMVINAAMIVYGVATVDFSAMGTGDIFSFAVKNINMTAEIVQLHERASLDAEFKKRQREIDDYYASKTQDETMQYIYTDGYDEYSVFYDVLYKY